MRRILLLCLTAVFMLASGPAWAQERTVTGRVTAEEDGSALPGVNVVVKGTTVGTVTAVDGTYALSVPPDATLVFSFIGLASKEVAVGSRSVIDVQMAQDVQQLSEIVVTSFGVERQPDELSYVAERIDASELVVAQQTTAAQGLAGKIAGLQINVQNNGVNPTSQILLRGTRSITGNNVALIVIDGMIATQSAFDDLNPNDIEDITVLKGANAASKYGSNATNGALIVRTKSGRNSPNRMTVGLQSNYTLDRVSFMPDFQTEYGIGWAGNYDPIENTNWGPRFDGVTRRIGPVFSDGSFQAVPYAPIKDNLKDFYETGSTVQNTVYFQGGDEKSTFYLSLGNRRSQGIVPDDEYKRTTFRVNATHKLGKVSLGLNSSYFYDDTDVVGNTIGDQDRPLYWFVLNTPANIPLTSYKDWSNPLSYAYADNYYNAYYQNPYWAIGTNRDMDKTSRLVANFNVGWEITKSIRWDTRLGVNQFSGSGKNWRARQEYDEELQPSHSTVTSFVEDTEFQRTDFNGSSIVSGNFTLNENFSLRAEAGFAFIQNSYRETELRGNNLQIPGFYDISNRTGELVGTADEEQQREFGIFGEMTIGYRDFLFLELTGRQDYTSTLALDNNSYFYPRAGVSFVASEAITAIKNSNVISDLKLTAGNSIVYNDLNPYQINERFVQPDQPGQFPYPLGPINGFAQSNTTVDPNIKKERLSTIEFGADIGFLNDRFFLSSSYFTTKITDLVVGTTPSFASAATEFLTNIGELQNRGFELTIGGTALKVGDFRWDLNVNYTRNETIVKEIAGDLREVTIDGYVGYGTYAIVGEAFPHIKASAYVRDPQGRVVVGTDGNPIVGEVLPMGQSTPDYILGATSQMKWKGLSLSATMDYRTGHVYYEQGSDEMEFTGRSIASVSSDRQDFVWPNSVIQIGEGQYVENTNIPITGGVMTFWQNRYNEIKENYVKDATALKLREVALNYDVPKSLLSKAAFINKLTVGLVGRNLLVFLPEENRFSDPEFNNFSEGNFRANSIGVGGYFQSPPTRSYGFNLTLEF